MVVILPVGLSDCCYNSLWELPIWYYNGFRELCQVFFEKYFSLILLVVLRVSIAFWICDFSAAPTLMLFCGVLLKCYIERSFVAQM